MEIKPPNPEENPIEGERSSGKSNSEKKTTAPSGRRQSLQNVLRQLTNEELSQSGTQKMLLDMLEEAENDREILKSFVTNFHEADKKAAILSEKLNADRSIEIFFGTGVGLGGAIFGLGPYFWDKGITYGIICLILGILLIVGSSIGRAIKK